jgi:hypothetical protein
MRTFVIVMLFIMLSVPAGAASLFKRPIQAYWENDIGIVSESSDKYYTNGLRLNIGLNDRDGAPPGWATEFRTWYCDEEKIGLNLCRRMNGGVESASVSLANVFYTPADITIARPQPLDRPWAGYMYAAGTVQITDGDGKREQHTIEAQLGILGPGAGGRTLQTWWHDVINDPDTPSGWHHQLRNEPVLNFIYTQSSRFGGSSADVILSRGASVGTLMVYPMARVTARLGKNITGFPVMPIAATAARTGEREPFEAYLLVGAEGRYVLHNALLDGGFFNDGPSVKKTNFVHDTLAGASIRFHSFRLTYNFVRRSEEFTPPPFRRHGRHAVNSLFIAYEPVFR